MNKKAKIEKHTRLRFTYEDDMALLKEFVSVNPSVNSQGWHIMLLMEIWLKKVKVDQIRSGVEEPQCERDALIQEVNALCQENNYSFKEKKVQKLSKAQQICNMGKEIREASASTFCDNRNETDISTEFVTLPFDPTNDHDYGGTIEVGDMVTEITTEENLGTPTQPSASASHTPASINSNGGETSSNKENKILGPSRKRINRKEPLRKNALAYLTDKHEKEAKIRIMELEIEKRKVAVMERQVELDETKIQLDEKRLNLEFKEKMIQLEIEKTKNELDFEQKKITSQLLTSQQQLIDNLLKEKSSNTNNNI